MSTYDVVTDRIIKIMEGGVIPWRKPWSTGYNSAVSYETGKRYSYLNQMLLNGVGEYLTFNEVKRRGGKVKKGEKARPIVFWSKIASKDDKESNDGETELKPARPGFILKYYNVFEVAQCEGIKRKRADEELELRPNNPVERGENVVQSYIQHSGVHFDSSMRSNAFYMPSEDVVRVPDITQFKGAPEYYGTVFHELVHSTGHESRLNRLSKVASFGSQTYSVEELIAEMGSAQIMNRVGFETTDTVDNNVAYLQSWLKALKSDSRMIVTAAGRAEKAVNLIIGEGNNEEAHS